VNAAVSTAVSASHPRAIVWSIAGLDTAGGAGLSADQRAADALGVHLCPVAACLTAQNSQGVAAIYPVGADVLNAQLQALSDDLPPRAIKTGLLGSVELVQLVAQWVDKLRARAPAGMDPHQFLPLVVDPVLKASAGGAAFSHADIVAAYRQWLLPRATVITPNRREALVLAEMDAQGEVHDWAALAAQPREQGTQAVLITGGDDPQGRWCMDWLDTPHAQGWLVAPKVDTPHHHGTGCTHATAVACALALGHVAADAAVLANVLTRQALMHAHPAGQGAGPVKTPALPQWQTPAPVEAHPQGALPWPWLGIGSALPWACDPLHQAFAPYAPPADGLYAIVPDTARLADALNVGLQCVQWRDKQDLNALPQPQREALLDAVLDQADAHPDTQLFVNDHGEALLQALDRRQQAQQAEPARQPQHPPGRIGLHLGQEDLLTRPAGFLQRLRAAAPQLMLGLSSHSLWELARAAGCGASYIACGPILPTTTKDMPWLPQSTDNLRWWVAHSPVPVVAIGGLLTPEDVAMAAACGPAAVCVVRGLGGSREAMQQALPALKEAARPRLKVATAPAPAAGLPHPVLPPGATSA
jgi:hydroxymethylpyrimidine kinase/phosphomethylpyrimidine kinase/thiamine-phosphate diphosphorylase